MGLARESSAVALLFDLVIMNSLSAGNSYHQASEDHDDGLNIDSTIVPTSGLGEPTFARGRGRVER